MHPPAGPGTGPAAGPSSAAGAASEPLSRARFRAAAAGLTLAGTLAGMAIAEGVVRWWRLAPEVAYVETGRFRLSADPELGYEMVPSHVCGMRDGRCDFIGPSNSLGFRDREHAIEKPPGVYRILVLGDSVAQGYLIDDDRAIFPALLEARLRAHGIDAEVLNFGVNGYDTAQEVRNLRLKGLRFRPDLVLVEYCLNDTTSTDGGIMRALREIEGWQGRRRVDAARVSPWLGRSALYRFVRYRVIPRSRETFGAETSGGASASPEAVAGALAALREIALEESFDVLIAIFPHLEDLVPYPYRNEHAAVRELADRNGFAVADLLEPFVACALASGRVGFDSWHPTPEGHACAAEALADAIEAEFAPLASLPGR